MTIGDIVIAVFIGTLPVLVALICIVLNTIELCNKENKDAD